MATYLSTQVQQPVDVIGLSPGLVSETFSYTLTAAGLANTDVVVLAQIPSGATLLMFYISNGEIDTGADTATWNIGDVASAARYVASSTDPRTAKDQFANAMNGFVAASLPRSYGTTQQTAPTGITWISTTSSVVDWLKITMNAAVGTSSTTAVIKGHVTYTLNTAS